MIWTKGDKPKESGVYSVIYEYKGIKGATMYVPYSKKWDAWNAWDSNNEKEAKKYWWKDNTKVLAYSEGDYVKEIIREVLGDE